MARHNSHIREVNSCTQNLNNVYEALMLLIILGIVPEFAAEEKENQSFSFFCLKSPDMHVCKCVCVRLNCSRAFILQMSFLNGVRDEVHS